MGPIEGLVCTKNEDYYYPHYPKFVEGSWRGRRIIAIHTPFIVHTDTEAQIIEDQRIVMGFDRFHFELKDFLDMCNNRGYI